MTRTSALAVVAAFCIAGTAFAQPSVPSPTPAFPAQPDEPALQPVFPMNQADPPADEGSRVWGDAAYLLGWVKGDPLPPLVTTSPAGTAQTAAGVLGTPNVGTLFGGGPVNTEVRSGVRVDFGYWFDDDRGLGLEFGVFALESGDASFFAASNGSQIIARPFFDVTTGLQSSSLVAFPGVSTGSILVTDSGRNFFGCNADIRENFLATPWCRMDALIGYQFLRYDERLDVLTSSQPTSGAFVPGTTITANDDFATMNLFNGVDLGLRTEFRYDALSLELLGKVAAGPVQRTVSILGTQNVTVPGSASALSSGGLLALSSSIGSFTTHTLTAVPQFGVNLGWNVTPNIRLVTGYSALWWMNVVRPGEQVDLGINPGLIPPANAAAGSPTRPAFTGTTSSVWAQTLSVGLEVKY